MDCPLIEELKPYLTPHEIEIICNKTNSLARAKTCIDIIASKMTTKIFFAFVKGLHDPTLQTEVLRAYAVQMNVHTTRV